MQQVTLGYWGGGGSQGFFGGMELLPYPAPSFRKGGKSRFLLCFIDNAFSNQIPDVALALQPSNAPSSIPVLPPNPIENRSPSRLPPPQPSNSPSVKLPILAPRSSSNAHPDPSAPKSPPLYSKEPIPNPTPFLLSASPGPWGVGELSLLTAPPLCWQWGQFTSGQSIWNLSTEAPATDPSRNGGAWG